MEVSTADPSTTLLTTLATIIKRERQAHSVWCIYFPFTTSFLLASILVIFGLVSNFLTIVLLWSDRNKSATMLLLILLSISDSVLLMWFVGVTIVPAYFDFMGDPIKASEIKIPFLVYSAYCVDVSRMMSIWLTVLVTWQRYIGACKPFLYVKYGSLKAARASAFVAFTVIAIFFLPKFFEARPSRHPLGWLIPKQRSYTENKFYSVLYSLVAYYTLNYIGPIACLSYMTFALIRALRKIRRTRQNMIGSSSNKDEVTLSIVIVVVISIFCYILGPLRKTLIEIYPDPKENKCGGVIFYYSATLLIVLFSGGCNFIVYVLFVKKLRKKAANLLFRRCCRRVGPVINNVPTSAGGSGPTLIRVKQANRNSSMVVVQSGQNQPAVFSIMPK
ncbi:hypothetical protein CAPTEDRAFT_187736 [Capitella teleta]|uniref:G-protein coupled receptors family 1 profile domain-containing protein n=1 Tax=Capitella teleta TaxID=283909 RepID=R7UVN3_CAPTE|nr:hypothetical protein CAPTEDRAFT_187736 [Capitella teleta]|eukprot:ELU08007.1 hypothetical protein CAPTEDRAFT_187736 [Capitella teleta]